MVGYAAKEAMMIEPANTPVFVLCGGQGVRLREVTELLPKPMAPIGSCPILWHIMHTYAHYGFKRFVLCLGYKAEVIKSYFLNYASMNSDFTVELSTNDVAVHSINHHQDWTVTLAGTGEKAMTGARVARAAERYLGEAEHFAVTYGDGLTDADLPAELRFHLEHGKIGTVLGARLPSRFGTIKYNGDDVWRFEEKPDRTDEWINGGYFFFHRSVTSYLSTDDGCILERAPLTRLASDHQLAIYKHEGFWECMDTKRDLDHLNELWDGGRAAWAVWEKEKVERRESSDRSVLV